MDSNYANAGGGGVGGGGHAAGVAIGIGAGIGARYSANYYKEPADSCQRAVSYSTYEPYVGSGTGVRSSSTYPYDAEAEFKERTGMGKAKTSHAAMPPLSGGKLPQHSYNLNNCYGAFSQNVSAMSAESANYYAYAYNQHHPYQQQQQQQPYHNQNQLEHQYKYNMTAKPTDNQHQQQQTQTHQQQSQQQPLQQQSIVNAMKMSTPEYGYAPYRHLQHPYYHPHYHQALSQKGAVGGLMKTMPDANAMPYACGKSAPYSTGMGGGRVPQYQANYPYHPHGYPAAAVSAGHHTYQSQSVCDDSRWMWNGGSSVDYQNSCRSAYPAYVNSSASKQSSMWSTMKMQYPNSIPTGYPSATAGASPSCCAATQNVSSYYPPQQYVKHQMQPIPNAFDGSSNDLYSNPQGSTVLPPVTPPGKVYTDLNAQHQENSFQSLNVSSYHQQSSCNASTTLDYSSRYLQPQHQQQQQQQNSLPTSSSSVSSPFSHHYYHNLHPYAHQTFAASDNQESLYNQQQGDTKIGVTTKSQSLRDFLTSWNEDEDECPDRTMISSDVPFMDQMHHSSDHYSQPQEQQQQQHNGAKPGTIMENHLQFKGSFTSRPKIHVGITVDSTVEPDQYINLPDIIIDIEKSNKDVVSLPEDILVTTIPKIEKEDIPIKEEKLDESDAEPKSAVTTQQPVEVTKAKRKIRRKFLRHKRLSHKLKVRLTQRNHRKSRVVRKLRVRKPPRGSFNPLSLKCLCVSLINSDKFRNRILLGQSEIDNLIHLSTDNEVKIDGAAALGRHFTIATSPASAPPSSPASDIPKLSDLCKNALNSSFDRDVLVINLDEILDSDNLFVVQCDINENILENYVDGDQANNGHGTHTNSLTPDDLVEILNDNNNNYDSSTGSGNYIPTSLTIPATACPPATADSATALNGKATATIKKRKRCCSVTEVSNLPLDNAVEHNNSNSTNTLLRTTGEIPPELPNSPCSRSCPPALLCGSGPPSPSLIEQNCPTQQITVGHEQLHEMLVLSGIVHDVLQNDIENDGDHCRQPHHHQQQQQQRENSNDSIAAVDSPPTAADDSELLMLVSAVATPSIHHEEIVPDNLKKFQNEKFLKYLHAKYVQGNLSEFYHANRIIKKYKKRIIKRILNIVR